jgi:beta-lactamase class A
VILFSLMFIQNDISNSDQVFQEKHQQGYKYISPLLECENHQELGITQYNKLRTQIINYIDAKKNKDASYDISIYFRDLNNGPWIGINSTNKFSPASLLKVPLLMAVLKKAEIDPTFLQQQIAVTVAPKQVEQTVLPEYPLDSSKKYSINDLLFHMIAYSDNNATATLFSLMPAESITNTYRDLGLKIPSLINNKDEETTVREYASFFRILYNSSYLSKTFSEKALDTLSHSVFKEGLEAGVKKGTVVAHKFGERQIDGQDIYQLHDCGIVYEPKKPYLLCVMTRGKEKDTLPEIISDISRITYQAVNSSK